MSGTDVIERVIAAAFKQQGERIELREDEAVVLVRGTERLRAGAIATNGDALDRWWTSISPGGERLPTDEGESSTVEIERAGRAIAVKARRTRGKLAIDLLIDVTTSAPVEPATPTEPPSSEPSPPSTPPSGERPLDRLLTRMVELDASDLHLSAGVRPMLRIHGEMRPMDGIEQPLGSDHILLLCDEVAPAANRREFRSSNDTDFAYEIEGIARFRVNVFRDRRGVGAVFRQIPSDVLTLSELGAPDCLRDLCRLSKGLVLVTGPTGSGKSTTLAAIIDEINRTRTDHVITIEDPIEFVHDNHRCLINQREVFSHTSSFRRALRAALREDPDIVLVGEMRDLETIAIAVETAETGHLVFGTLHTTTAISTVDRIIDQFPADRQEQIRVMLADSLKGIVAQTLCRRIDRGRVAAYEILLGIPAVANLIREGKSHQLMSVIQTNRKLGMRTLNDSLAALVRDGVVEAAEALLRSVDKDGLRALLKRDADQAEDVTI